MFFENSPMFDQLLNWLSHGVFDLAWWQLVGVTLALTHITIASVTIFLHRHQAHRALELGPIPSHFFRFWLWLTTGQVTKEWAAVHRKHHAKCETPEDPHSPQTRGLKKVLTEGAELYRDEANNAETRAKYGHGTPDDWLERNIYTGKSMYGVVLMLLIDVGLFGAAGLTVWAVQMMWIPVTAAGIINGVGHYWGYRNFEAQDASTNIVPWGILIGGEELHNNHHTYPTSAKLSVKPYEFDLGWVYIRVFEFLGWASIKKTPPKAEFGDVKPVADAHTLEALIANRYELMAGFAKQVRRTVTEELTQMRAHHADTTALLSVRRWLHRDVDKVPSEAMRLIATVRASSPVLDKMLTMREELRQMWVNRQLSREQLTQSLQSWCNRAETSGIQALVDFSVMLRTVKA